MILRIGGRKRGPSDDELRELLRAVHADVGHYSRLMQRHTQLRNYQLTPARAIVDSVRNGLGETYVALFARQSGKDEMLAQLCAYLLSLYRVRGGRIIVGVPAVDPQGVLQRDRVLERLHAAPITQRHTRSIGYEVRVGKASIRYLSASEQANPRGQTASLLLVANEAQDIDPAVWDARFAPMAASTNATTLVMGTTWSDAGLLARELRALSDREKFDNVQRIYRVPWPVVAAEVPAYGTYVRNQIAKLGATNPFIRTEYELEELSGAGGLFPADRRAMLRGTHPYVEFPGGQEPPGVCYAMTIDVAGEEEDDPIEARADNPRRDATALSVWRVIPPDEPNGQQRYELVYRYAWTGIKHSTLHDRIVRLARDVWKVRAVVIDATGVGAGLASFLSKSLGDRVVTPFTFSLASKSRLGWDYLAAIDGGRVAVAALDAGRVASEQRELHELAEQQHSEARYTLLPGPGRLMRWSVPSALTHDDLLISQALVTRLDEIDLRPRVATGRKAK